MNECSVDARTWKWALTALFLTSWFVGGIGAEVACGKDLAYHVQFRYRLTNKTDGVLKGVRVHIPIPQPCGYQEVRAFKITPPKQPHQKRDVVDQYGQKLCQIVVRQLAPRESTVTGFECDVVIHPDHRISLDRNRVGTRKDIPRDVLATYTSNVGYIYDLDDPEIRTTAARLVKPHRNLLDRVMAIHDFVAGMKYKRDGRWDTASVVLRRRNGSCSEFSYLFCALCRSAGIPTRFAGGTCCRLKIGMRWPAEDRVYHRWAEVYLPPYGWVPFDVTRNRGNPPKRTYVGAGPKNVLILTRGGAGSHHLGNQYIGSNNEGLRLKRERVFLWSPWTNGVAPP